MSRWHPSRVRVSVPTVVWITAIWVLLWGEISAGNVLAGLTVGLLVQSFLPLPAVGYHGRVRPGRVGYLVFRFLVDLVAASLHVAFLAVDPRKHPRTAVVGVQLRTESDLYLFITSEIATLVPGSVVVEAVRRNGVIYVHVLDLDGVGGAEAVRRNVLAIEERVLRALASDEELSSAGLSARGKR